ncbi:MAG: hypothetical protein IJ068_06745 [Bacilli bacterium]|nr:hypothetical protein [Bacilli bacterium]
MMDFIEFKDSGICNIQVDMIIKKFTLLHRIYKNTDNEYWLLSYTPKAKRRLKVQIKEEDAIKIINTLHLTPFEDSFFRNSITYVPTT